MGRRSLLFGDAAGGSWGSRGVGLGEKDGRCVALGLIDL